MRHVHTAKELRTWQKELRMRQKRPTEPYDDVTYAYDDVTCAYRKRTTHEANVAFFFFDARTPETLEQLACCYEKPFSLLKAFVSYTAKAQTNPFRIAFALYTAKEHIL